MNSRILLFLVIGILLLSGVFLLYQNQGNLLSSSIVSSLQYDGCSVVYKNENIGEDIIEPIITPALGNQVDSTFDAILPREEATKMLDIVETQKIENNLEIDFSFSQSTLQSDFFDYADNIQFTYDAVSSSLGGRFTIGKKTYICKPLAVLKEQNASVGYACEVPKGDIFTCNNEITHSMSYECNTAEYLYRFKRCIFPPLVLATSAISSTSQMNQSVTWKITARGGSADYTYSWSGTEGLTGTSDSISKVYTTPGRKIATITVTSSDGQTQTVTQKIEVAPQKPLTVSCSPVSGVSKRGQLFKWAASAQGGNGTYTYTWSGTDRLVGQSNFVTKAYTTLGKKTAKITVISGSSSQHATCTLNVIR